MEYEVVEAVKASNMVIVSGDIGFRKRTQIPKVNNFYYQFFFNYLCNIKINDCEFG